MWVPEFGLQFEGPFVDFTCFPGDRCCDVGGWVGWGGPGHIFGFSFQCQPFEQQQPMRLSRGERPLPSCAAIPLPPKGAGVVHASVRVL